MYKRCDQRLTLAKYLLMMYLDEVLTGMRISQINVDMGNYA